MNFPTNTEKIDRLRQFAVSTFGSARAMSTAIGRSPDYFATYFSKNRIPGRRILNELVMHGLDLDWLETGERREREPPKESTTNPEERSMDDPFLSDLWNQVTAVLPGVPQWEDLSSERRREVISSMIMEMLRVQQKAGIVKEDRD